MKKPKYLKTSFWKRKIKEIIIKIFLLDFFLLKLKKNTNNKKVLIITLDALGDNVIKNKTIKIIEYYFGKENTYILCKNKWEIIYKIQGYSNIFVDETKWSVLYKIKLYRKLNKIGFGTIVVLNHSFLPPEVEYIIGGKKYDMSEDVQYILEKHLIILNKIFNIKYSLDDIKPDFNIFFPRTKYKNVITIAVGTADYPKTPTYENLRKYIESILRLENNKIIYLLGTGNKQYKVANKLEKYFATHRVVNVVDKLDLKEVMQVIKDSDLFIGGDSGLYNIAFALGVKTICLHWKKNYPLWEHKSENVVILKGAGGEKFDNLESGTDVLNSITVQQLEAAIEKLGVK
ncbi:glycosyltransferase family 9 protein [Fusobacterium sp.]|uniref:glycosyltransferase family 9 protein n=1 Tax=Fusobacterium sp. TaxID=68766 RepID=UPI00396CB6DF